MGKAGGWGTVWEVEHGIEVCWALDRELIFVIRGGGRPTIRDDNALAAGGIVGC